MGCMDPMALTHHAGQAEDRIKYLHDAQKWESESTGKLYYSLWILFMGGFVLSLSSFDKNSSFAGHVRLIHVFRILAILGSVLNFLMQSAIINSSVLTGQMILALDRFRVEASKGDQNQAESKLQCAEALHTQRERYSLAATILSICAEVCAAAFLVLALIGTWNLLPGAPS